MAPAKETKKTWACWKRPVRSDGGVTSFIYEKVPKQWMDNFMKESRHPVFELELLPIVIALCVFGRNS